MKKIMIVAIVCVLSVLIVPSANTQELMFQADGQTIYKTTNNEEGGNEYIVFFDREIGGAATYRELVVFLYKLDEKDTIYFKLFTPGGDAYASLMIYNSIQECKAKTIADIYFAYSGGSIIAMACDEIKIHKFSKMMIHGYQLGGFIAGSSDELRKIFNDADEESDEMLKRIFGDFLTRRQLQRVLDGENLYLNEEELTKLIERRKNKK